MPNTKPLYECRLCLELSVFSFSLIDEHLVDFIESLAAVKISETDELQCTCCEKCLASLQVAYELQQKIVTSDKILQERLSKVKEESTVSGNEELITIESVPEGVEVEEITSEVSVDVEIHSEHEENFEFVDTQEQVYQFLTDFNEDYKKRITEKRKLEQSGKFECKQCNTSFDNYKLYHAHSGKHKFTRCSICDSNIRSDNFKRHFEMHSASKEICEICGKTAKNKESLRGHMFYQHRDNPQLYKCEECNREFRYRYKYTMHVRKQHTGQRDHQCKVCSKKFFTAFDTKKHVEMTHLRYRPHICSYCKRGYSSRYALKTHVRQHTLETPFRCEICAAGFRQKVSLRTHLKSKHNVLQARPAVIPRESSESGPVDGSD